MEGKGGEKKKNGMVVEIVGTGERIKKKKGEKVLEYWKNGFKTRRRKEDNEETEHANVDCVKRENRSLSVFVLVTRRGRSCMTRVLLL